MTHICTYSWGYPCFLWRNRNLNVEWGWVTIFSISNFLHRNFHMSPWLTTFLVLILRRYSWFSNSATLYIYTPVIGTCRRILQRGVKFSTEYTSEIRSMILSKNLLLHFALWKASYIHIVKMRQKITMGRPRYPRPMRIVYENARDNFANPHYIMQQYFLIQI